MNQTQIVKNVEALVDQIAREAGVPRDEVDVHFRLTGANDPVPDTLVATVRTPGCGSEGDPCVYQQRFGHSERNTAQYDLDDVLIRNAGRGIGNLLKRQEAGA